MLIFHYTFDVSRGVFALNVAATNLVHAVNDKPYWDFGRHCLLVRAADCSCWGNNNYATLKLNVEIDVSGSADFRYVGPDPKNENLAVYAKIYNEKSWDWLPAEPDFVTRG